ncbi:hypothetical protein [Robiginitalea sp. IMCC43444]|uniref:hypothetical protein n=1 Tax=Robiginitalea sp. IMCC43444 TaxID=3459121 RepID=UPI00404124DA
MEMIQDLSSGDWDIIIFGDTDDCFSVNRVEKCVEVLGSESYQIAYNDLSLTDERGAVYAKNVWGSRAPKAEINLSFLLNQNVLGLGNTAIKKNLLSTKLRTDDKVTAFDWMFYLQLFYYNQSIRCKFIPEAVTYYRQHGSNSLGLQEQFDLERISKLVEIKSGVLRFAVKAGIPGAGKREEELQTLSKKIQAEPENFKEKLNRYRGSDHLFWFEELTIENEKN